ncbi:HslU--HslV peptidase proteolytic subunit [Dolosigranulum pigrum]|jgi:ATP-dependent protease hslVU, peptidase subunit|uniref:ATP-dependent protease subunit HslV n=2 Tax=Dolosigranulum TaxID=29393 RepID=A0A1S8KMA3_9LACT|nr:HslU--HslV peptidase proteolytic subunit [Dolosigranulum pigrum]OOL80868.1 HslU--HslV peptidase proteolytic subunit [Dolosigranulum pigrum]QJS96484.1 HslU--HslV peptidase proteolytic subunit [Dolosigranulum pigrum]QTJ34619.1 HslU--HslV peptidase proteolytic subunit [Dolosigranulum pigrum]QTJ39798.1 HslU--HslV peptidase proteolytic subunit [Dolosigranulum pigrum]QTJ43229.1 HslU--HslV peptidase proteolytic subunit [Dolosigranulum pigrum]
MTTILAIQHDGQSAMSGDGQVTLGEKVMMKGSARKVRKIHNGEVLVGFAGSVSDAITLEEKFEGYLNEHGGNLQRAAVELAKEWRTDKMMKNLEALLIVMNKEEMLLVSGNGEVISPDDGILSIGSGGNFALSAARMLKKHAGNTLSASEMTAEGLHAAADICVYTNHNVITETL